MTASATSSAAIVFKQGESFVAIHCKHDGQPGCVGVTLWGKLNEVGANQLHDIFQNHNKSEWRDLSDTDLHEPAISDEERDDYMEVPDVPVYFEDSSAFANWICTGEVALRTLITYLDPVQYVYIIDRDKNALEIARWNPKYMQFENRRTFRKGEEFHYV